MTRSAAPAIIVLAIFAALALGIALYYPFPSPFDELQHYSVVRAQWLHPDLFADPRSYGVVRADALDQWSGEKNYINHPALYYLLLAPLSVIGDGLMALRLANVLIAVAALALVIATGWRLFDRPADRAIFAIIAASFPKAVLLAGMINNDNLAALAAALVFAGLGGMPGAIWLIAGGLALAGWTKLTALIALGTVVAVHALMGPRDRWLARPNLIAAAGAALGASAYAIMWLRTGALVPVNIAHFTVPLSERPHFGFTGFVAQFLSDFVQKWPSVEYRLGVPLGALLVIAVPILAIVGARVAPEHRRTVIPFLIGAAALFAIHLIFGWRSFEAMGDLTIAQTRYYAVVWPGLALGGAAAIGWLRQRHGAAWLLTGLYLLPTILLGFLPAL